MTRPGPARLRSMPRGDFTRRRGSDFLSSGRLGVRWEWLPFVPTDSETTRGAGFPACHAVFTLFERSAPPSPLTKARPHPWGRLSSLPCSLHLAGWKTALKDLTLGGFSRTITGRVAIRCVTHMVEDFNRERELATTDDRGRLSEQHASLAGISGRASLRPRSKAARSVVGLGRCHAAQVSVLRTTNSTL